MRVRDLMTPGVVSCRPETNLAAAAALMSEMDCGVIPVVDENGNVTGVITDRDICIALGARGKLDRKTTVGEVNSKPPFTCRPDDEVHAALETMTQARIRRLPVISDSGKLVGILSLNDLFLRAQHADGANRPGVSYEDVVNTMVAIGLHDIGRRKKPLRAAA